MTTPTLSRNLDAQESLRRHLAVAVPDADIRSWHTDGQGMEVFVGPRTYLSTDFEVRPEMYRVATAIDPFVKADAFTSQDAHTYLTYRWTLEWEGVRVVVKGEGKGDPVVRPRPLPLPTVVAA